ncbi:(Trans)glycosidase [Glarea lozoyensis ATCC 20868]|uniref:(Trans)glycosidase n=1 Tax=Glarea lozoyensis (strain ATCC 20868 / MF5171) TaxID=1116229 RepID=S3CZ77_GLAL2|nr:(Trans)glycosidase [Glarea lozoyensis ATCC 20868]EPE30224.1 (Trans)glycosidase [Glarea lozoyensis ATCC 20868]
MHFYRLCVLSLCFWWQANADSTWQDAILRTRQSTKSVTVDLTKRYQTMDGFGISEAFQRANVIVNLPAKQQREILDLLFNTTSGAGLTILRNGIGSSPDSSSDHMNSIAPKSPGSPTAAMSYVWDKKDSGQLFVSKEAWKYGVRTFYANAWSAPGYMKTNGNENNGGYLCGVSGKTCSSGDWKQTYANYLVKYLQFYQQEGIEVTHVGFLNEPEFSPSYAGMLSSGTQAADFIKVLALTLKAADLSTTIACCDSEGWGNQGSMTSQIKSSGAENLLSTITSHSYTSSPGSPLSTTRKVWQTENADLQGAWQSAFYSNGGAGEGMRWAGLIHNAVVNANCSAYLYWIGVQTGNTNSKLISVSGTSYSVSKRLWAFGHFARGARPGAVRVGISGQPSGVQASAYLNRDGNLAIVFINTGSAAAAVAVDVKGGWKGTKVTRAWVTDNSKSMADLAVVLSNGAASVSVPGRSMVSLSVTE